MASSREAPIAPTAASAELLETGVQSPSPRVTPSATRSGLLLAAASVAAIVANYVFLLAAGRILGSESYGSLAALLGLLTFVLLPAGALQMAVSREISRRRAAGNTEAADAFARAALRLAVLGTVPILLAGFLFAAPLAYALKIHSPGVIVLAELVLVTALVFPSTMGVLQGRERFNALAFLYVFPFALRLVLLALLASAGYRLGGAVMATLLAQVAGAALAVWLIRDPLRRGAVVARPDLRSFLTYLGPVVVGLIGIAFLTQSDILVVKARFPAGDAGAYAAASAFARVAFFVPAAILAVLFPRTAARYERGEDTSDILGRSLIVTLAFCVGLALFYAAAGQGLVVATFGTDFAPGGKVLAPFALAIGLFSLANVLVGYHLSRGETRFAWIIGLAVVAQIVLLATFPVTLREVVWANVAVGAGLIVAHELFVGFSLPALRVGMRHFAAAVDTRVRHMAVEGGVVLLASTAFVCALFWPLVPHLSSTFIGDPGSDAGGSIWWLWRLHHEGGYHVFGTTHHTLTGAPFGWNDPGNGYNLQFLVPYYPAYLLEPLVGAIAAYNLILLAGYVLSGASMYLLARYLGCVRLVSAWAGMVYIVFPWHLARVPHASLAHLEFLPLLVIALIAAARKPDWLRFGAIGAATLACWLTSGYFGPMALVGACVFAVGAALTVRGREGALVLAGTVGSAVCASLVFAILGFVSGVGRGAGLERVAGDLRVYGLRPLELLLPSGGNLVFGHGLQSLIGGQHGSNPTETRNYVGLLTLALAATWLGIAWRRRSTLGRTLRQTTAGLAVMSLVAFCLALPSPVGIFGHSVWMPSRLLWEIVPAVRVPARWVVLTMTGVVPLGALALQALWERFGSRKRRWKGAPAASVAVVAAAVVVSFLELTIVLDARFDAGRIPSEYRALSQTPRGIVAEYPQRGTDNLTKYTFWQRMYGRPLLNGAPGGTPAGDASLMLVDPATPGTASQLSLLGVTAIVTHPNALTYVDGVPPVPDASWGPGYSLASRSPDGSSLWRVVARPAPALVTLPVGFGPPDPPVGGVVWYPLVSTSGVGYVGFRSEVPRTVRLSFDAEPPAGQERTLRLADNGTEQPFALKGRTPVSVVVAIPRGYSLLLVKTDPPPTSAADAIHLSAVRADPASGQPQLHALLESAAPGF